MTDQGNPTPPDAPPAPPGWYPDPVSGEQRWWDGTAWTVQQPPAAPAVAKPPVLPLALFAFIGGIAAFVFGWVPVLGLVLALGAGTLAVLALIKKQTPRWMPLVGIALATIALITSIIILVALATGVRGPSSLAPTPTSSTANPIPTPEPTPAAIPDVVGQTVAEANATLDSAGFEGTSTADADWVVSAQDPAAGDQKLPGTRVTLTAEQDFSAYDKLSKREFAQMAKNPDTFAGRKVLMFGNVWQFDSATGPCNALVDTAYKTQSYSFDYEVTTWITGDPCSVLDPVVEDDEVALWVTVVGAYSYDTAAGGTNTAVEVTVQRVKIY